MISIITVTLNNRAGLVLTAESILHQTQDKAAWEWIVIDGNSSDGTQDVIRQHEDSIAYWVSEPDGGIYEAMNKALFHAKGEYVLFLNAGDAFCSPEVISKVMANEHYGKADYLSGDIYYVNNGKIVGTNHAPAQVTGLFLFGDSLSHPTTFIRKERLQNVGGYDTSYRIVADAKFFFQDIVLNNASYASLNFFITYFDVLGISATQWMKTREERDRFLSELLPKRIHDDYRRMCYGETTLEKLLCKIKPNSLTYRFLTGWAILLYAPIAAMNRLNMYKRKILK